MPKRRHMDSISSEDGPTHSIQSKPTKRVCSMKSSDRAKPQTTLPDVLKIFTSSIEAIFESRESSPSQETLFMYVENCCKMNLGQELDTCIKEYVSHIIKSQVLTSFTQTEDERESFFSRITHLWTLFWDRMTKVRTIFLLVDKDVAARSNAVNHATIWDSGITTFRDEIMLRAGVAQKIVDSLISEITQERLGMPVNRSQLWEVCHILSSLNLYQSHFLPTFLTTSKTFYQEESDRLASSVEVREYLKHFMRRLQEERERVSHYLDASTEAHMSKLLLAEMIFSKEALLVDQGCGAMFLSNQLDGLSLLYTVLELTTDGLRKLKKVYHDLLKTEASNMVKNPKNDQEKDERMIVQLLELRQKAEHVRDHCFAGNADFARSVREAFEYAVNLRSQAVAQFLAKHVDQLLRSGGRGTSEQELDLVLDKSMSLFRCIDGKDVFKAFYRKDLAKRLLFSKSASEDAERSMLSKLKHECGPGYTYEMETMFQDVDASETLSRDFKTYIRDQVRLRVERAKSHKDEEEETTTNEETTSSSSSTEVCTFKSYSPSQLQIFVSVELSVNVIRPSTWPTYKPVNVNYPDQMAFLKQEFQRYYSTKYAGKRLNFVPTLGTCHLKTRFDKDKAGVWRELILTELQALILLQFNHLLQSTPADAEDGTKILLKTQDLVKSIGGDKEEIEKALLSLSVAKGQKLLVKKPSTSTLSDDDEFWWNRDYQHKLMRIKLSNILVKETKEEVKHTEDSIWQNRKIILDCAIVRVLKTRKEIEHADLISTLQSQLNFPCAIADIKRRIDDLIERNYISRDAKSKSKYIYVA